MRTRPLTTGLAAGSLVATTLAAVTGLAGAAAPSSAAADSTPGYSLRQITVQTMVGPNGDQPCAISADLYTPDGTSGRNKAPAILTTHGFGGSKDDSNQTAIGKGFVKAGYVVLSYSGLGFGGSGCKIHLDDPQWDGKAGSQMVDVLAGTRAFTDDSTGKRGRLGYVAQEKPGDPRVGMIGGSYGGQIQYAVAMQDKRVDALIPIITWNDLSYSLAPNNTSTGKDVTYKTPGVAKKQWIDLFFSAGLAAGAEGVTVDPSRISPPCPNFADEACPGVLELNTLGYPTEATLALARSASVSTYMKRIKAPTLLVQGQKDTLFNLQESVATFRALSKQGTPTSLVWQSWGHSGSSPAPGELDFDAKSLRDSYLGDRFLSWMNHYVRGTEKASVGPRFSYFRDWVRYDTSPENAGTAIDKAYVERRNLKRRPTARLFLTGSDALTRSRKKVVAGSASYANAGPSGTSYSETSGVEGNQVNNDVSDAEGTYVAFTSKKLARKAVIVGSPRLRLRLSAPTAEGTQMSGDPAGKLILFAKLYDVAPDGTVSLQNRLISPVRVTDVTKPVNIRLPGVVQRIRKGHQIRLVVAASDMAYANNAASQPVTVSTSRKAPGVLGLPLTRALRFR